LPRQSIRGRRNDRLAEQHEEGPEVTDQAAPQYRSAERGLDPPGGRAGRGRGRLRGHGRPHLGPGRRHHPGRAERPGQLRVHPYYQFWAITVIALDVFVIWALAAHGRTVATDY
jgi:hypothetical protein